MPEPPRGADDPAGDLAAIGDEQGADHRQASALLSARGAPRAAADRSCELVAMGNVEDAIGADEGIFDPSSLAATARTEMSRSDVGSGRTCANRGRAARRRRQSATAENRRRRRRQAVGRFELRRSPQAGRLGPRRLRDRRHCRLAQRCGMGVTRARRSWWRRHRSGGRRRAAGRQGEAASSRLARSSAVNAGVEQAPATVAAAPGRACVGAARRTRCRRRNDHARPAMASPADRNSRHRSRIRARRRSKRRGEMGRRACRCAGFVGVTGST